MLELKKTIKEDLETLFVFQTDEEGIQMAAFTAEDPSDKKAYLKKWSKIVTNKKIAMQTIRLDNRIIGSVIHFDMMDEANVSYWIDRQHWGKGYATEGLKQFIDLTPRRPLFAQVAFDNIGSQRVLEKAGFKMTGREVGFANARKQEIEEFVYRLD